MADFNALEALINAYIKQNGVQAITGQVLNGVLRGMVSALGKGWTVAGEADPTTDPGTMTGPVAYIAHTAGTYGHFGNLVVNDGEVAFLKYNEQTWTKEVLASLAAAASVDGGSGTPSVTTQFVNGVLTFAFSNLKGTPGDPAGFGTVAATVDGSVGTPGVTVQESGPDTAKNFTFAFTGLKGETGVTSAVVTVDNTVGTPQCAVSLVGQELHLDFTGLKGAQGNPGSSVDYPFTLVNNLTTNDATQALTAAMGVQLESEITQLEAKVGNPQEAFQTLPIQMTLGYFDVTGASVASSPTSSTSISYCEIPVKPGEQFKVFGYGGTSARLWCFVDESRNVLSVADESIDARTTPAELTAPASSAILIYQATGYDPSKDKVENPLPVKIADTLDGTNETKWTATGQTLTLDKWYNTGLDPLPNNPSVNTGCACIKMSVQEGDIIRITGVASSAGRLWATADSSRNEIRRAGTNYQRRACPEIVTIASGETLLYVTLWTYDSQTDKVEKLISATDHEKGLVEKVADLEERIIPSVDDTLDSTSTTDALSANQGRVLNEDINGVTSETQTDQTLTPDKYFNTENSRIPATPDLLSDSSNTYCCLLYVTPGDVYRIYGKGENSTHQLYALADADRYVITGGVPGVSMNTRTTPLDLTIPDGVAMLAVNLYQYDATTDKVQKIGSVTSTCVKTRLNALEQADEDLSTLALPLKGKKGIFFGDSVTYLSYNGKGVVFYFNECAGVSFKKAAVGGARFVQRAVPTDTPTTNAYAYAALDICNMVKAWCDADYTKQDAAVTYLNEHSAPYDYTSSVNAMKSLPIADADFVLIGGGTNDMSNNSPRGTDTDNDFTTIKGSINKMIELLLTANPKLKIYFYSPVVGYHGEGGRTDANWDDNYQFSSGLTKPEYIDIFADRARKNHIPYINLYWTLGWNQTNFSQYFLDTDDHHPYKGFDVIGRRLYRQVVTNLE